MYNVYYKANEISAERSADQQYTTHSYRNRAGDLTTLGNIVLSKIKVDEKNVL